MNEEYNKGEIVNNIFSENNSLKLEIRKLKKELAIKEVEINDLKEKNFDLNELEELNKNFRQSEKLNPSSISEINSDSSEQKFYYQLKNAFDTINSLQKEKDQESDKLEKKIKNLNNEIKLSKEENLNLKKDIEKLNDKISLLSKKQEMN